MTNPGTNSLISGMKRFLGKSIPFYITILFSVASTAGCRAEVDGKINFETARERMVDRQIAARGIKDKRVLKAFRKVERHLFVDSVFQHEAYDDNPLPIGKGQTISQPYIVALMTEVLDLKRNDKVLEIGTGSGYQAAILGELVDSVFTIEIIEWLGVKSGKLLERLGYDNILTRIGDGYRGWPEHAPFDAIIVTCAPDQIPEPLMEQLSEDGGRMVIPVGIEYQDLVLVVKQGKQITKREIAPVRFVPMTGESQKK